MNYMSKYSKKSYKIIQNIENFSFNILETVFSSQEKIRREDQLKNILSQAEDIIKSSPVKTGRNHPIFSFVTAITRNIFYSNMFQLNATFKDAADFSSYRKDLGLINNTSPDEYTILNQLSICLNHDAVLPFPWEPTRFTNCLTYIGTDVNEPFLFQPNNHFSKLILPLGLTIIYNGNHSTTCGIIKGEGFIEVKEIVDNSENCDNFYFDGTYICRNSDNSKIHKIKQFEYGVLFELSRLIHTYNIDFLANINIKIATSQDME